MEDSPRETRIRPAQASDSYALAELMIMAADGMYEFLLEEMAPREMLAGLVAKSVRREEDAGFSWRHSFVAERGTQVIGMVNAYPAAWLEGEDREMLPHDRVAVLDAIDRVQEWSSYLIAGIAVRPEHRRRGIGSHLLGAAILDAEVAGFAKASLNVWADNEPARAFFTSRLFRIQNAIELPLHPKLSHRSGVLLMVRELNSAPAGRMDYPG